MKPDIKSEKTTEDYLEAMLILKHNKGYIRSIDVAQQLGVTKPSVTYTTKRLKEKGYIVMDESNYITITENGMQIAEKILHRHNTLASFFVSIGVNEEIAKKDACLIEHDISPETFEALCSYIDKKQ